MNIALNIRADNSTAEPIAKLWDKVGRFEEQPSMHKLNYAPHFTFAIYEDLSETLAKYAFDIISQKITKVEILFSEISYFDTEKLVLWLKAADETQLHNIHLSIHELLPVEKCHEYYKPKIWQPHCTLGVDIAANRKDDALEFASNAIEPFKVKFDIFDVVSFLPVKVMSEAKLP